MKTRLLALPLAAVVALGACGGDDSVSKEEFADQLDKVCVDLEKETQEISAAPADDPDGLARQLESLRSAIRDGLKRMRDIERPEGEDGDKAERYIDELERTLDEELFPALEELEAAVRAKDERKIRVASTRLQGIDEGETQDLARELGADSCAEDRSV